MATKTHKLPKEAEPAVQLARRLYMIGTAVVEISRATQLPEARIRRLALRHGWIAERERFESICTERFVGSAAVDIVTRQEQQARILQDARSALTEEIRERISEQKIKDTSFASLCYLLDLVIKGERAVLGMQPGGPSEEGRNAILDAEKESKLLESIGDYAESIRSAAKRRDESVG